jgi:membrane protease YdiL (CAAX protease family)
MAMSSENLQKQEEALQAAPPDLLSTARYPVHNIFVGPEGLHAGWRLLLFVFLATAIGVTFGRRTSLWHPRNAGKLWQDWLIEFELFLAVLIAGSVMAKIERRPLRTYGLPLSDAFRKHFWMGALWGLVWLTVLMVALRLAGGFYFGGLAIHGARILKFAAFYALLFLTVALFEEFAVRGYPLFTLTQTTQFWPAAVLLSTIFGAMHYSNSGEGWVGLLGAAMIGLFFCLTVRRTGTLWFAVGFHASWDWGESYLYSVPDSGGISPGHLLNSSFHGSRWLTGGSVGPEGSLLVFVVIALLWVAFDRVYREAKLTG